MEARRVGRNGGGCWPLLILLGLVCILLDRSYIHSRMQIALQMGAIDVAGFLPPTPREFQRIDERAHGHLTTHFCHSRDLLEDGGKRATCLFHNLCVVPRQVDDADPREVTFLYVTPDAANGTTLDMQAEASFTLGIGPHSGDSRVVFTPLVVTQSEMERRHPDRRYIKRSSNNVLLYEYNAQNFGHLLADFVLPIYAALESFDQLDEDVQIYRYSITDAIGWSCDFQKTKRPGSYKDCLRFYDMVPNFFKGHSPIRVLNGTSLVPTCFETLAVGMPMYSDDCLEGSHGRKQDIWSLCNHARQGQFWRFRNYVLSNVGVSLEPPTRHKITVGTRASGRTLHNLNDLVAALNSTYNKTIEVMVVEWPKLSLKEQFEVISTTTIHLTPPGGTSMIGMFLPRWATQVTLYSGDFRLDWHIFHYLGYMTVDHVDCAGGQIPIDQAMKAVAKGLNRFESFCEGC